MTTGFCSNSKRRGNGNLAVAPPLLKNRKPSSSLSLSFTSLTLTVMDSEKKDSSACDNKTPIRSSFSAFPNEKRVK